MESKAFSLHSSAKYRLGCLFKEKSNLSLVHQQIAVVYKGSHFQALFPDIFANYQVSE